MGFLHLISGGLKTWREGMLKINHVLTPRGGLGNTVEELPGLEEE